MTEKLVTNGSINFERTDQAGLNKVRALHDEHSKDINHDNDTIYHDDSELNSHGELLNLDKLLAETYGKEIDKKNANLDQQFADGKISFSRYNERKMTVDKYLNHSGKSPKKAFTLGVCYVGDFEQTKQKLDALGFKYEPVEIKGSDGEKHTHFYLTDSKQRKQWAKLWRDTYVSLARAINKQNAGIKIFDVNVHMDEASPHAHFKILNIGRSKSGRLSYNLNQSLSDFNSTLKVEPKLTKNGRLNGKATLVDTRKIIDEAAVQALNQALKKNGLNLETKFEHKGKSAEITNGMTAKEAKQYLAAKATADDLQNVLSSTYEHVTGKKAVEKDNSPLGLENLSRGVKRASKQAEEDKKKADEQKQKLENQQKALDNQRELDQFNSFVRQKFIERLNQRRLVKLRQREKALNDRENEQKENLLDTLVTVDPEHMVKPELLKKNEVPQKLRTQVGRSQHKRQTLQYLAKATSIAVAKVREKASEAEQKVKNVADNFIKIMYGTLENYEMAKAKNVGSQKIVGSIQESQHPFSAKREKELLNDPSIKIKQALLFATNQQLKQGQHYLQSGQEKTWKTDDKLPGE